MRATSPYERLSSRIRARMSCCKAFVGEPVIAATPAGSILDAARGRSKSPQRGAEQYPGFTNWSGVQAPLAFQSPHQAQQIVQQLLAQILPIAQQTIMAQVVSVVTQQLQQYLPPLIMQHLQQQLPMLIAQQGMAQQTMAQHGPAPFTGQQPGLPWAQPTVPQYPS